MKGTDLAVSPKDCWRNIPIPLIDRVSANEAKLIRRFVLTGEAATH
jgi:hypothetical protein